MEINLWLVYLTFFGLLSGSLLGYFFNYHIILLQADQKDYIVAKYYQTFNISKIVLQAFSVFYLQSFVLWISLEVLSGLLYTILIRKKIFTEYPWLLLSKKVSKDERKFQSYTMMVKKIKQISIHKIGEFFANGLDNILIFFFLSAELVAYFANYQMVLVNLGTLVTKAFAGSKASVGNLVAENKPDNIKQVFWEMMVLRYFIGGFGAINIYYLINPFIGLWLGQKYILSENTVIVFAAIFYLRQVVQPTEVFKQAYGLYDDVWAPIIKSIINLTLSIILVQQIGIVGLLIGTFCSVLSIEGLWRPYYVYKWGFKSSHMTYVFGVLKLHLTYVFSLIITYFILSYIITKPINYYQWILNVLLISLISAVIYGFLLYASNSYCRDLVKRLKSSIIK
ncbi:lipopolysaccharide biosynthesis protein [Sediminicola sp. 1XM1-17]|uniref:lipopolysaccharide biosynthesis protein n=1 Tax=Sediminicola sp. 1XM1-17 TaxID=3127702 RepID=UPI00307760EC